MAPVLQPDDSLAVLLKGIWPIVFTLMVALLKRRKTLLKWLKESVHILAEDDKRATDEHEAAKPESNGVKEHYLEMNLEQFLERFRDAGEDIRDANRRIEKERKERLDDIMTINAEMAKITLRIEAYRQDNHKYSDSILAQSKVYTDDKLRELDSKISSLEVTVRRGFEDIKNMLNEDAA